MTRVAPRSSPGLQARQSLLDARWRVGVRGSLNLTVVQGAHAESAIAVVLLGSERFVLEGNIEDSDREVRLAFSADSDLSPAAESDAFVVVPENPAGPRAQRRVDGFSVTLCPNPNASEPDRLLLTDLPVRLGLMGGTYVLESIRTGF